MSGHRRRPVPGRDSPAGPRATRTAGPFPTSPAMGRRGRRCRCLADRPVPAGSSRTLHRRRTCPLGAVRQVRPGGSQKDTGRASISRAERSRSSACRRIAWWAGSPRAARRSMNSASTRARAAPAAPRDRRSPSIRRRRAAGAVAGHGLPARSSCAATPTRGSAAAPRAGSCRPGRRRQRMDRRCPIRRNRPADRSARPPWRARHRGTR